jgi:hypothetical protein
MQPTLVSLARAAACVLAALLFCASVRSAPAATPATNDACADAMIIPPSGPFPYWTPVIDIANTTTNGDLMPPGDCATNVSRGIWFKFTPAATALYTLSLGPDTLTDFGDRDNDSVLALYTTTGGCDGPFTQYACEDDAKGFAFALAAGISTNLSAGTTYYIVAWVGQTSDLQISNQPVHLQLRVTQPTEPANNTCAGAVVIPDGGPFPYLTATNDTTVATNTGDPADPGCAVGFRSVWYKFTPATNGTYVFATGTDTATTVGDTVMTLYHSSTTDCNGTLTALVCNDNGEGRAAITTNLVAGTTYFLVIWDGSDEYISGETSLQLRVSKAVPPAVTTLAASNVTMTSATLRAQVNPNGLQSRFWFEWGTTTNYTATNTARLLSAGTIAITTNVTLNVFMPGSNYHFRAVATNTLGKTFGADQMFEWSNSQPLITGPSLQTNGNFQLQFTGSPSQLYTVQGSTTLTNWTDLGTATDLGGGLFQFIHTATGGAPYRFYKVRLP